MYSSYDLRYWWAYLLGFLFIGFSPWVLSVPIFFDFPSSKILKGYWYSLLETLQTPVLVPLLVFPLMFSAWLMWRLFKYNCTYFGGENFYRHLRGAKMVSPEKLRHLTKRKIKQLDFCSIPVPIDLENKHFSVAGSTGGGKTVAMNAFMSSAEKIGSRLLVIDPNGDFLSKFWQSGDVILNPFDSRTENWSIFNEIRSRFDCKQYAITLIPKSADTQKESFNAMGRVLVSETMIKLWEQAIQNGTKARTSDLIRWLVSEDKEKLENFLKDTPAASLFEADETYGSIKAILSDYLDPHQYLADGDFSIRDFLDNKHGYGGNIWITWRQDMLAALKPLVSCWTDTICASILSMEDQKIKNFVLAIDELGSLENLNYLDDAATKGRKAGLRVLVGFQSLSQLDSIYGKEGALTLRNSFRSFAVCSTTSTDTQSVRDYSIAFGKHEVIRYRKTVQNGNVSESRQHETEPIISETEISSLPPLTFYVQLAGFPVCKVKMPYVEYPERIERFVLADNRWTRKGA